jgi:hypothetical protein
MIIRAKIDVTKIDKAALFIGKNGAKYLDITLLENRNGPDQYGNDFMCVQDLGAEARKAGRKGAILGNAKKVGQGQQQPQRNEAPDAPPRGYTAPARSESTEDVPF